jgi:hypothetical protein
MRGYAFLGTTIAVTSDLPSTSAWLDEFLIPAFDPWTGDVPDFAVRIVSDPVVHEAVASSRPPGRLHEALCFALDQEIVRHPSWTVSDRTVLADERRGIFYVLAGTQVDVVVHPRSDRLRVGAMRVIRELAVVRALSSTDRLQLHAAGLDLDGRGLLLAGPKGAGKTTLLGYLASSTRASILTNDRVILRAAERGFAIHGIPTIVTVRPGTLALLPRLAQGVPAVERPAHLTLAEVDAALACAGNTDGTVALKLSPPQLARQLGVTLGACAELGAIAFPEAHPDPDKLAVEGLAERDAERRLLAARFGLRSGEGCPTAFEVFARARRPAGVDEVLIAAVAAQIPCFAVRTGARRRWMG